MAAVFGIEFSPLNAPELLGHILNDPPLTGSGPRLIVTANLDHVVTLERDQDFRNAYNSAWTVVADGAPVYVYAKLRGACVGSRITGADLFTQIMYELRPEHHRCFFVASSHETADLLREWLLRRRFSADAIAVSVPPYGFEYDRSYSAKLADSIRSHGTTHLFFGVGAPKSEKWCNDYRSDLGDCYVLCAGAGLEFFAGVKRRAPAWMQHLGLEWLWRAAQEPRRLSKRYFAGGWKFVGAVLRDLQKRDRPPVGNSV